MKVLVTGGLGYLGQVLYRELRKNHTVGIVDSNLYDSAPIDIPMCVYDTKGNRVPTQSFPDIRDNLSSVVQWSDVVIHLAGIVGDKACELDKNETIEVNTIATKSIAELCRLYNKKLVFASSCSVYGESGDKIFDEESSIYPVSLYAKTKAQSETSLTNVYINEANDLAIPENYVIFRMGTLFGLSPRMRFDLAINRFVAQAYNHEAITVYGGDQWRPFLHLQDAVQAYVMAVEGKLPSGIYNVASFNAQLKDIAYRITPPEETFLTIDNNPDKRSYQADISKIKGFGFSPKKPLTSIKEIWEAFEQGQFKDWRDPKYDNFLSLSQRKVLA